VTIQVRDLGAMYGYSAFLSQLSTAVSGFLCDICFCCGGGEKENSERVVSVRLPRFQ
jgi:hypothetical protein